MGQSRAGAQHELLTNLLRVGKNSDVEVLVSAERTETIDSEDLVNDSGIGAIVIIDVTAVADTPSIVFKVQGKDPVSGKYYDILASAAITGVGTTVLRIHPAFEADANVKADDIIPSTWRVRVEHSEGSSITYSVGAVVL